jgi:hypothetical protein
MTPEVDRRDVLNGLTNASAGEGSGGTDGTERNAADPPPNPPYPIPPVYCLRVTDIVSPPEPGRHFFEFEILNWSAPDAHGLVFFLSAGTGIFVPPSATPTFAGAGTDPDGIPLLDGDSDANYPPDDGTSGTKTGAVNTWETVALTPTLAVWFDTDGSGPVPGRDLLGAGDAPSACDLVPGCTMDGSDPVISDPETVDNGAPSTDSLPDNTLDGFVLEVSGFFPGMMLSFDWFLLDAAGSFMGVTGPSGEEMAFGTFSIFNAPVGFETSGSGSSDSSGRPSAQSDGSPGPALYRRVSGAPEGPGQNAGVGQRTRSMFTTSSENGGEFMAEAGAALSVGRAPQETGPLLENCNIKDYDTNAKLRYCSFDQLDYYFQGVPDNATVGETIQFDVNAIEGPGSTCNDHVGARIAIDGAVKEFVMGKIPDDQSFTLLTVETTFDERGVYELDIPDARAQTQTITVIKKTTVGDYADEDGLVKTVGLLDAIDDWRADLVETPPIVDVIDAWRSDNPVV